MLSNKDFEKSIKKDLDEEQYAAVTAPKGNTCVFAIAGSGKTRVLTYRVAYLINNGEKQESMMLITFTNKAANEMTTRIKSLLNEDNLTLISGTFHSIAYKFLKKYINYVPKFKENFTVLDETAQETLIKKILKEYLDNTYGKDDNTKEFPTAKTILGLFSNCINHHLKLSDYLNKFENQEISIWLEDLKNIFLLYKNEKIKCNCFDFDDLLLYFSSLLRIEEVNKEITSKYKHIFVDEYQDINWMQYDIIKALNKNNSLFAIGDSCQCIYQFRGANDKYIDLFKKDYPEANQYRLTYNYRSTPEILKLAHDSINNNDVPFEILLNTKNKSGVLPNIIKAKNEPEEAMAIAQLIAYKYSADLDKVAILIRSRRQAVAIQHALLRQGTKAHLVGVIPFAKNTHVADCLAVIKWFYNKEDFSSFARFAGTFNGIGAKSISSIYDELQKANWEITEEYKNSKNDKIIFFLDFLQKLSFLENDFAGMFLFFVDNYYNQYLTKKFEDAKERFEDLLSIYDYGKNCENIDEFLEYFSLDADIETAETKGNCNGKVSIITMHKSKGLEWEHVIIPNLSETIFPRCTEDEFKDNLEPVQFERKLFYVAITRAKKTLDIFYVERSFQKELGPSPFLNEFDRASYKKQFIS